jgi:hypothetical protein
VRFTYFGEQATELIIMRKFSEMQADHLRKAWTELHLCSVAVKAPRIWQAADAELQAACEWYLDQPGYPEEYRAQAEAFLDFVASKPVHSMAETDQLRAALKW